MSKRSASSVTDCRPRWKSAMNCLRWSMGDVSSHGIEGLLRPRTVARKCHPCPRTVLLPLSPDRTLRHANSRRHRRRSEDGAGFAAGEEGFGGAGGEGTGEEEALGFAAAEAQELVELPLRF